MPRPLTKEQVEHWLSQNRPHIKLLEWSGRSLIKSKFLDTNRSVEFFEKLAVIKTDFSIGKNTIYGATKEEKINKLKKTYTKEKREKSGKKQRLKKEDAVKWLEENAPHIEILEWGHNNKDFLSKFYDKNREFEFKYNYRNLKSHLKQDSNYLFYPTKQEKYSKVKKTCFKKYGVDNIFQDKNIIKQIKDKHIKNKRWELVDGLTISEWSKIKDTASNTSLYRAKKMGIHPLETSPYLSCIEIKIKNLLLNLNLKEKIDFYHGKKIPEHIGMKSEFLRPDFLIKNIKLIIECDGDHPHANPIFFKSKDLVTLKDGKKILAYKVWEKDKKRNQIYSSLDYNLLTFWGSDIENNWEKVKKTIIYKINSLNHEAVI